MDNAYRYRQKFSSLFEVLSQPRYEINNDWADSFIDILKTEGDNNVLASPFLSDLVLTSLLKVEEYSLSVQTFLIKLIGAIANHELQFTKLLFIGGFKILQKIADISDVHLPSCIRMAFINLADNIGKHTSGVIWLHDSNTWKHIFNMCYQKQTMYIKRRSYEFLTNLAWKTCDLEDEERLVVLFKYILKPLVDSPYQTAKEMSSEDEQSWIALLEPTLEVILKILTESDKITQPSIIVRLLTKHFIIDYYIHHIAMISHSAEFNVRLATLSVVIYFAKLLHVKPTDRTDEDYIDQLMLYFNVVNNLIRKRMTKAVLDFSVISYQLWIKVGIANTPKTFVKYGRTFELQNQVITLPVLPILHYVFVRKRMHGALWEDFVDGFVQDLSNWNCEHTIRACYMFRSLIKEENQPKQILIESMKRLFVFKTHLNYRQVGTVCRTLFYLLNCYSEDLDCDKNVVTFSAPLTPEDIQILNLAMDLIHMLLHEYEIEWHECFELTCLYNKIASILKAIDMPCKFIMRSLDVITLAMKKFLHPNLALLSESRDTSALDEVGELIHVYLEDGRWEVQDSATRLLLQCIHIARMKYIPLRKVIITSKLLPMLVKLAFDDTEFYVQASSIKCLAAITKIHTLWEAVLEQHSDLYRRLLSISQNSHEALVRKEAICIWRDILDEGYKLPVDIRKELPCTMLCTALDDLHWEVQIAALSYWQKLIDDGLKHYGMIDGSFPPVTFSKQRRKIIHLNDHEIKKCLIEILQELASSGCLKVLYKNLADDVHPDVMEAALNISKHLMKILNQYDVISCPEAGDRSNERCGHTNVDNSTLDCLEKMDVSPDVDTILSVTDIDLLTLCESQLNIDENVQCRHTHYISANVFIDALTTVEYEKNLKTKREWNAGNTTLHALLDEMLDNNPITEIKGAEGCE